MILISNDFCHKIKMYNFEPYNVLLSIATDIPVLLMTVLCCRDTYDSTGTARMHRFKMPFLSEVKGQLV